MKVDLNFSLHSLKISSLPSIKLKPDHFSDVFLCIINNSILYQWSLNFFVTPRELYYLNKLQRKNTPFGCFTTYKS